MRIPSPPANERERLAALARHQILDTEPEDAYDDIAALAAHVCGTPIALVSLVAEHRQWFKARIGVTTSETDRDVAFCSHVVESGELLVVEDARQDPRFADNPFVSADPSVAFYAGAPLQTREGYTLGTLCAIDHRPRRLSDEQLAMLRALSRLVVRQLEMRLAERERHAVAAELVAARARADRAHWLRQRFFDASLDLLCIAGFDGYFKELNPAWHTTLGWTPEELSAKPFIEFVHPDDRANTIAEAAALGQGEHVTVRFENRYLCKSGEYRWLSWTSVPDMANQVLIATARDVSLAKARERELLLARQLAETSNQAKSDFLAKMSHELRTPLNSVIGFTNLLHRNKKGNLDAQDLLYLDKIAKNGLHLLSLINDLLDLSKIEAGHAELNWGEVDVAELIRAVFDQLEGVVADDGNRLLLSLPTGLAPIRGDGRRLKQILINLIGNANKFTKRGAIELRVVCRPDAPSQVARIDVVDSGIGIPAVHRERVFEAFRQVSEGDARTYGGTGLGLTISRSLAQLHGFDLGVVSVEGRGSTFYLAIDPASAPPEYVAPRGLEGVEREPRASPPYVPASSHQMVLLIDDDGEARQLVAKAVEQLGARIVAADSGEAGFTIAQAILPDLIVIDLGLPDVHGREIVRRLSADPRLRHIPVIIHSGQVDHALDAIGSVSVLEKPVTLDEIASVVGQQLGARRRVLIVDDDDDTREVLRAVVHRLGVETTEASDGEEALCSLRRFGADLVLLDICMPNMTGFEFLAQLRGDPELAKIPVVVCTALDLDREHEVQFADQARAVIRKGYNVEGRLEEIIRGMIRPGPAMSSP